MHTGFWRGNLREGYHLEVPGVDRRIILKCIFEKWDWWPWTGSIWLRTGTFGFEFGNEPSCSIKCGKFPE